jgi:hypothetical protein
MPDGCLLPRGSAPIKHRARRVARPARRGAPLGVLGQVADHLDEFLSAVAVPAGTFTGPAGTFRQTAELTKPQRDILDSLQIPYPKKIIEAAPATPADPGENRASA